MSTACGSLQSVQPTNRARLSQASKSIQTNLAATRGTDPVSGRLAWCLRVCPREDRVAVTPYCTTDNSVTTTTGVKSITSEPRRGPGDRPFSERLTRCRRVCPREHCIWLTASCTTNKSSKTYTDVEINTNEPGCDPRDRPGFSSPRSVSEGLSPRGLSGGDCMLYDRQFRYDNYRR